MTLTASLRLLPRRKKQAAKTAGERDEVDLQRALPRKGSGTTGGGREAGRTESLLAQEDKGVLVGRRAPSGELKVVLEELEHLALVAVPGRLLPKRADDVRLAQGEVEEHGRDRVAVVWVARELGAADRLHRADLSSERAHERTLLGRSAVRGERGKERTSMSCGLTQSARPSVLAVAQVSLPPAVLTLSSRRRSWPSLWKAHSMSRYLRRRIQGPAWPSVGEADGEGGGDESR